LKKSGPCSARAKKPKTKNLKKNLKKPKPQNLKAAKAKKPKSKS